MPRQARSLSAASIYHVMLRGINRQNIFEDDSDKQFFMTSLGRYRDISGFTLYAFCLMSNHVHLLIEPGQESLETIFRRIGTRYAIYFNKKYDRVGHLFQDRFRSEPVQGENGFLIVLRYILQNPMKAGMETRPGAYRWSSYLAYEKGYAALTDVRLAMNLAGGQEALLDFLQQTADDDVMDEDQFDRRLREDRTREIMRRITGCDSVAAFQKLEIDDQKKYVLDLYMNHVSGTQIARMTGVPKTSVYRIVEKSTALSPAPEEEETDTIVLREISLPW